MSRRFLVPGLLLCCAPAFAGDGLPPPLRQVGIAQEIGQTVPLEVVLRDEAGQKAPLAAYLHGRPAVLVPTYYQCPMLCSQVLNALTGALKALRFDAGRDFDVLAVSFDPRDTPALAAAKKAAYLRRYGRPTSTTAMGWRFLTAGPADAAAVRRLMDAIGFRYAYDPASRQYAHAAAIVLLTPQGRISRYLLGADYAPRELRLGLIEASEGRMGTPIDRLLLFCYRYDPTRSRAGRLVLGAVRAGGVLTLLGLAAMILVFLRREPRERTAQGEGA